MSYTGSHNILFRFASNLGLKYNDIVDSVIRKVHYLYTLYVMGSVVIFWNKSSKTLLDPSKICTYVLCSKRVNRCYCESTDLMRSIFL